jgi:hypothetical protein
MPPFSEIKKTKKIKMKYIPIILLMSNVFCLTAFGQPKDIVQTDGIKNQIHKDNIGKITFMTRNIPLEEYKETDFLTTFELKQETNLNIRVFMDNSITNYMHRLEPELSADELNLKGNYQFSFWVDDN